MKLQKIIYSLLLTVCSIFNSSSLFSQEATREIESVEAINEVNTNGEENNPVITSSNRMYFMRMSASRKKASKEGQEIWLSQKVEGEWTTPSPWKVSVNDNANNVIVGVSKDESRIYYFNSLDTRQKLAKGLAYVELNEDGGLTNPIGINIPGFEVGLGFYSFYVTPDEEQFFVATANDGADYEDLFVSLKQNDGSWGELINLGTNVNTNGIETTPFLTADKKVLYFSSDGHGGFGSADIYRSERTGEGWSNWTSPENLGPKINSPGFDASYVIIDENTSVFSSNRKGKFSDLYEVQFKRKRNLIKLIATATPNVLEGTVSIAQLDTTSRQPIKLLVKNELGIVVDTIYANSKGKFQYKKLGAEAYTIALMDGDDAGMEDFSIDDLVALTNKVEDDAVLILNNYPLKDSTIIVEVSDNEVEDSFLDVSMNDSFVTPSDSIYADALLEEISSSTINTESGDAIVNELSTENEILENEVFTINDSLLPNDSKVTDEIELVEVATEIDNNQQASTVETTETPQDIELMVYFGFDSYEITEKSKPEIDSFIEQLALTEGSVLAITGHTDSYGPSAYNAILAERRAHAVKEYFILKGITVNYTILSKGEEEPIASNSTVQGRKMNRRVSVSIERNSTKKIPV